MREDALNIRVWGIGVCGGERELEGERKRMQESSRSLK